MNVMQFVVTYAWVLFLGIGLAVGVAAAIGLWRSWAVLGKWVKTACGRLVSRSGFFWVVNLVFMAVSVLHAGVFFGITGNGHDVPGIGAYIGFAVSFFLDLVTIILMQALLEARYRGDDGKSRQLLLFIVVCCGTSTFANLAVSLNDFNALTMLPHAPSWVQAAAPYVLASFPLFVIMMALAAELIINVRPLDKLKAEDFESDEKKRIEILDIRNRYLLKQVDAEIELQRIRAKQQANKSGRVWLRLPWLKTVDIDEMVASATKPLETAIEGLKAEKEQLVNSLPALVAQVQTVEPVDTVALTGAIVQQLDKLYAARFEAVTERLEALQSALDVGQGSSSLTGENASEENGASDDVIAEMQALLCDYPGLDRWISSGQRTVTEIEIVEATGHTAKMVSNRVKDRTFAGTNRKGVYRVGSVVRWLKVAPLPKSNKDTTGRLEAVRANSNGHSTFANIEELVPA